MDDASFVVTWKAAT